MGETEKDRSARLSSLGALLAFVLVLHGTGALAQSFYARGDGDCSLTFAAADVVATARAIEGESACGNDDCDRDGQLTAADADCAARCLFGECAVPANAPQVTLIEPDSAADVVPGSVIAVRGSGFGAPGTVRRVTVGGVDAEVVGPVEEGGASGSGTETLLAIVPDIEPGDADLVVFRGEIAGTAVPLSVAAPMAIGTPDTVDDVLALLDEATELFLRFDLSADFSDENAAIVRQALTEFRARLAEVDLGADEGFDSLRRAHANRIVDGSGIPEQLRELVALLQTVTAVDGSGGAAGPTQIVPQFGRVMRAGLGMTQQIVLPQVGRVALLGRALVGGVVGIVVIEGLRRAGGALLTPEATSLLFRDPDGDARDHPIAGGTVEVNGSRLDPLTTRLRIRTAFGNWDRIGEGCGLGCLRFTLPASSGFCGSAAFSLVRGPLESSSVLPFGIQPQLLDLFPRSAGLGALLDLTVEGTLPCTAAVLYTGPQEVASPRTRRSALVSGGGQTDFVQTAAGVLVDGVLRELPPGGHDVQIEVDGVASEEKERLSFVSGIAGLDVQCDRLVVRLPPASPSEVFCRARPGAGSTTAEFPVDSVLDWTSSDARKLPLLANGTESAFVDSAPALEDVAVRAKSPGTATVTADLFAGGVFVDRGAIELRAEDTTPPTLEVGFAEPGGAERPCVVPPDPPLEEGTVVEIRVRAEDNVGMSRLQLSAPEESVDDPMQGFPCVFQKSCRTEFTLTLLAAGNVDVAIEAVDASGLRRTATCRLAVGPPPTATPTATAAPTTPRATPTATPTAGPTEPSPTVAPPVVRRLVGHDTQVPGHETTFTGFLEWAVTGDTLVFIGRFRENFRDLLGIYALEMSSGVASLRTLVDGTTVVPGTEADPRGFRSFSSLSADGDEVVFSSSDSPDNSVNQRDVYRTTIRSDPQSGVQRVLRSSDVDHVIHSLFVRGGFLGGTLLNPRLEIVVTPLPGSSATLEILAGPNTPVPGGSGSFAQVSSAPSLDLNDGTPIVAFIGRDEENDSGVYTVARGGSPRLVADEDTAVPGGRGSFRSFRRVSVEGDRVAFVADGGFGSTRLGVYTNRGGVLTRVADPTTSVPGGDGRFDDLATPVALSSGIVFFESDDPEGVFADVGGALVRVVGAGDVVDGNPVRFTQFRGDTSVDGRTIVLFLTFEEFSDGALYGASF